MNYTDREAISVDVGLRLKQLREARGVSMRTLATMSGLSANALSMIERGKTSPSVSTLYRLATALEIPITNFFSPTPAREKLVFLKSDQRTRLPFMRGLWEGLGGENFDGKVMPFLLTLESGASSGPNDVIHTGHEFVFCLRGQLEYQVEDKTFLLETGDSLLFAANLNHRWRNPGSTVTSALILLSDFSEAEKSMPMHILSHSD